jgi:hypothetical protein
MTGQRPAKTLRTSSKQPDSKNETSEEGTEPEKTLEEKRIEGQNELTSQSNTKSLLTDPNYEVQNWAELPGAPRDGGIVLGPHENMRVEGEPDTSGTHVRLTKPVYRAFKPMGSKRWAFTLEHPEGAVLPMSMVRPIPTEPVEVTPTNDDPEQ